MMAVKKKKWKGPGGAPLVVVEWVDSHRSPGWHRDDADPDGVTCYSAGWLVHRGKRAVTVTPHATDEDDPQKCGCMTIPTVAIIKISKIKRGGRLR